MILDFGQQAIKLLSALSTVGKGYPDLSDTDHHDKANDAFANCCTQKP